MDVDEGHVLEAPAAHSNSVEMTVDEEIHVPETTIDAEPVPAKTVNESSSETEQVKMADCAVEKDCLPEVTAAIPAEEKPPVEEVMQDDNASEQIADEGNDSNDSQSLVIDEGVMASGESGEKNPTPPNDEMVIEIDDEDEDEKAIIPQTVQIVSELTSNAVDDSAGPATKASADESKNIEVFYNKECINCECPRKHKQYYRASHFVLQYYQVNKKQRKPQYICAICYDQALDKYEELAGLLAAKQPLFLSDHDARRYDYVEIIDSSDEEDNVAEGVDLEEDNAGFSENARELIEQELENCFKSVFQQVNIQKQLTWCKTILETRTQRLEAQTQAIGAELQALQRQADIMHERIYQYPKQRGRVLQTMDLNNSGRQSSTSASAAASASQLPPWDDVERHPIEVNGMYYAVKTKAIASWVPCRVIEQVEMASSNIAQQKPQIPTYKIKLLRSQYQLVKTVSAKHLAYYQPPAVRLPIGSRVIAYFDAATLQRGKEKVSVQSAFYPGIIAEPLRATNKYRYLIFYDDGYTQYVLHQDVRLVCHVSENVWEDVHFGSRDFIQKYLMQYAINRPMVQTQKGQSMQTESDGKWMYARVIDIDCSLVQMQFEGPKTHTEWIYRGSARLGPVYKEFQKSKDTSSTVSRVTRVI